ncbi:arginine N-methyltransferase 2 [Haematococcus lacustris]
MASANDLELALLDAAASGDIATLSALVENGVDVSYQDQEGMSALMKAADGGYQEAVELLLQAGCPWNLQDKDGYCAGQYAAGNPEIVELLLNWGVQAELVLGAVKRSEEEEDADQDGVVNQAYLSQPLHYSDDGSKLLDADGEAVMMGWEGPLMERHAALMQARGGAVLNIGFGLGLIDAALQAFSPTLHTIIEAHPDVFKHAQHKGWGTRPGVQLLHGRWQEVLPRLVAQGQRYDGVFFDTYGEYYREMAQFHKQLPALLKPGGVYTFFNGLAPDNVFFHSVYGRLVQLELAALGLSTSYEKVDIQQAVQPEVWAGVRNKYWHLPYYFLPKCVLAPDAPHEDFTQP